MTLLRRAITVPLATVLMIGILIVWPLLLAIGGVAGLIARSSLPVRTLGVLMAYALLEVRCLRKLLRGGQDCDEFMRDVLERTYIVARRTLKVEVLLDNASPTREQIPRTEPVIVLSRHCGPGDTLLVAWLLNVHYGLQLRIVLKALLRCEPVLDLTGDLGGLCFLHHRSKHARRQIHDLAASLGGGQALLLFPEGGNFTWKRWRAAVIRLRSSGRLREARRAWRQSHTLPPRTGGTSAALSGASSANVLVLTHTGFSPDGRARAWWRLPMNQRLVVRTVLVPAVQLPSPDQLSPWLQQTWSMVDAWVAGHADAQSLVQ
jgi:1-acyl-sn-glycerol-3-phosphate acyltransferase